MRHNVLTYQNRVVGVAVIVFGVWAAFTTTGTILDRNTGTPYFTLTTDVMGVQVGSILTLNGFEVGQVTAVAPDAGSEKLQSAAELLFRVDFQVVEPFVFPAKSTFLSIEEVNPVAPARLVFKQRTVSPMPDSDAGTLASTSENLMHRCPVSADALGKQIPVGGCIPTLVTEQGMGTGLGGLVAEGKETLRELRTSTLPMLTATLRSYRDTGAAMETTIEELGMLGEEVRGTNARFAEMLSDRPGSLYRLPVALEDAATRVADVSERLHGDVVERVDRMVAPETIAALARAVAELEGLIATSSHSSLETLENLAAITRSLNQITWELERNPVGFLRGSGRGTR